MACCSSATESWSGLGGACSGHTRATAGRWWWRGRQGSARRCCWRRPVMRQGKRVSGCCERAAPSWNGSSPSEWCASWSSRWWRGRRSRSGPGCWTGRPGWLYGCWACRAWASVYRGGARSLRTPRSRSCTDCTGCAPTWPRSALWRWWSMTPTGLTVRRFALWPSCCPAWRNCPLRCCWQVGQLRRGRVRSCWPP